MKQKVRKIGVRFKLLTTIGILFVVLTGLVGFVCYGQLKSIMIDMGAEQAKVAARTALLQINVDELTKYKPGEETSAAYAEMVNGLRDVQKVCGVLYLSTISKDGNNYYYSLDTDTKDNVTGKAYPHDTQVIDTVFAGEEHVSEQIDQTEYGAMITASVPVKNAQGDVVAVLESDYDASSIEQLLMTYEIVMAVLCVVFVLVAIVLINFVVMGVTRGIGRVNSKLYELVHNEGDLTQTIDVKTGDEMELMAGNLNELLGYIREIMLHIADGTKRLEESCTVVVGSVGSAQENILDVSATMEEMSAAMQETSASLMQVNEEVNGAYENIDNVANMAKKGYDTTLELQKSAKNTWESAQKEQKEALVMASDMEASVKEKIELSKNVEQINTLTQNILSITAQTNMLALNASIEAARAGEMGKGFAVVASEIGHLAADSAAAATQIKSVSEGVIESVEALALEAERMIAFMQETAMEGYNKLLKNSEEYRGNTENICAMMEQFNEASKGLAVAMDRIKESMNAIESAVEESAKGITDVAETASSLTGGVADVSAQVDENKKVSDELLTEVQKFKLQ